MPARSNQPVPFERVDLTNRGPARWPGHRRLPFLLLMFVPLVLGGVLAAIALTPPSAGSDGTGSDFAATLAAAVTRGQGAIVESADQGSLARILGGGTPTAAAMDKARGVLDSLVETLGAQNGTVVLIDVTGRTRLAIDHGKGSGAAALATGGRDVGRVLALRSGALAMTMGAGSRSVLFAAPVSGASGGAVGALIATVPLASLFGPGAVPGGVVAVGSTGGATWTAVGGGGTDLPLSRQLLFALAILSLVAIPLAWWARRTPRPRPDHAAPVSATTASLAPATTATTRALPTSGMMSAFQSAQPRARQAASVPEATTAPIAAAPVVMAAAVATAVPPAKKSGRFGRGRTVPQPAAPMLADSRSATAAATATPPEELLDPLTGLGNQRHFGEELDRLLVGWERNQVPFSLLLLDVDDLKITNARSGHAVGDEQLRALGRHIRTMLRFSDRAFRIGGDEFAVLLPHTDTPGAVQMGQRLLTRTRAGEGGEPAIAFSAGAAAYPGAAQDRDQLMAAAGAALAWAKCHGRTSVLAYDPATQALDTDADRMEKETAVAQVIRERSLLAAFQPIVDMQTGDVVGFEGLTRPAPGAPFTNPGQLFEAAELAGRTVELDAVCFETIAEGARAIPADRVVSINLSPRTMEAADFSVEGVLAVLRSHDLDPGRVILELTERETVLDLDRLRDNLSALQRAGVRIAADDVGAGNAGLRLLSQFRFDIVKVDLSLVQEGTNNDASRAILRSLRDLAQRWGAFVIAEGIETSTQLKVVRELGLAAGQGFLIGRPGYIVDLPPVDLVGLEQGGMMMQMAPQPVGHLAQGVPA